MRFGIGKKGARWWEAVLFGTLQPEPAGGALGRQLGQWTRQGLAVALSALMILIPMGQANAFAQGAPYPAPGTAPAPGGEQQPPQAQPLSPEQLDQLVAPIALYPDALVAQVLAAATYPTEVVQADRWRQAQGNVPPEQIAAGADAQNWDASVKALTAFPSVLAQMDRNLQWTTDLGNAYYNQPQDVMDAIQGMRQRAQAAGQLRSTPQQTVSNDAGQVVIAPANPTVVYVPVYNPWVVYGAPLAVYPGFYYAPPPGIFWGGLAIGFGVGIGIGLFAHWGWGWGHWGVGWGGRTVVFNHNSYFTHSTTVINRGFGRPGGPPRGFAGRGAFAARPGGGFNRPGGYGHPGGFNRGAARPGFNNRAAFSGGRPSASYGRPAGAGARSFSAYNRGSAGRPGGVAAPARGPSGGGRPSGGGHPSGGAHPSGGGGHSSAHSGGGHQGHGR